jgi:hypothetical protein
VPLFFEHLALLQQAQNTYLILLLLPYTTVTFKSAFS